MKSLFGLKHIFLGLAFLCSTQVFAASQLDGKTFCRTVQTGGMFGQPKGERQHCVHFEDGKMTDNANTFFGNLPETIGYDLQDETKVVVTRGDASQVEYQYLNNTLVNNAGAILTLK